MRAHAIEPACPIIGVTGTKFRLTARLRSLKVFAALLTLLAMVSGSALVYAVASAPLAAAGGPGWAIQATDNSSGSSATLLGAVSCPSATACMAVGDSMPSSGYVTFAYAELWDGTSWKTVPPVEPAGATTSYLRAVSCTSAAACTAVGYYQNSSGTIYPLAERWNGISWTLQFAPVPAGSTFTELSGVSCTSATTCTAVGFSENPTTNSAQDLAEFWDGRTLFGVRPRWTIQPTQAPFSRIDYMLNAVSCSSATDCLAVGRYLSHFGSSYRNATWAEHWNGTSWSGVLPDVASSSNNLLGVSCTSATACTAVGYYQDSSGMNFPLAESWNGTAWALQSPEFPASSGGTLLWGVSCASATACTAVGETAPPAAPGPYPQVVTLAESWDGTSWTLGSIPNPTFATQSHLYGVSCPSVAVCTAVGFWDSTGGFPVFTLAERYS